MENKEIINHIKQLTRQDQREMPYEEFVKMLENLSAEEIMEVSKIYGYPVFIRKCMGTLQHKIPILQDGAAAIIENDKGEILLQSRKDNDKWGLPGGCQEAGERFQDVVIREIKEEDLELIDIVSGLSRKNEYPNGDVVINNTALYHITNYSGNLAWDEESKDMKFFSLNNLPKNQNDPDLIKVYINKKRK